MVIEKEKKLIGRAEHVDLPVEGLFRIPARVDTGAKTSTIWASQKVLPDGSLEVVFFGSGSEFYTGERLIFKEYDRIAVASSNGHIQKRFKIRLLVKLKGKKIRAWFTLADRSSQVYPVLIGRNILSGKYIVDVKKGHALKDIEKQRDAELDSVLRKSDEETI